MKQLSTYNQKLSHYIGIQSSLGLPPKARATALKGVAVITIRVDELNEKSNDYIEFIILEEFCHLLDYKGNATPKSNEFWEFTNKYKQTEEPKFVEVVVSELNSHFNHYNVNLFLMKYGFEKWIKYRHAHYGKQHQQKFHKFYDRILVTHSQKQSSAIMITEMLKVISFLRAVESYMKENEGLLGVKTRNKLQGIVSSVETTVSLMEEYAQSLDPSITNILTLFSDDKFIEKGVFF